MAKGIREREFQNLMIQWSLPMGWGFTAGRSLPRERRRRCSSASYVMPSSGSTPG